MKSLLMKICQFTLRQAPAARALSLAYVCVFAAFNHSAIHAQTSISTLVQLPTVVVTASSTSQLITDALPHTTVISQADIIRSQATDITTLLEREAGFQFTHNGGRGLTTGLSLRGAATMQVLLMIDGVPMTKQDASGSVSYEHLMLDQIDHIEIVRGNVSAIYGSGAIGGVVQIFTKHGGKAGASLTAEVGSRGSYKLSGTVQNSFNATKLSAGYSVNKTDGFSAMNPTQKTTANADEDGYRNKNWSLGLSHELTKGHVIGFKTTHSTGNSNFDSGSSYDASTDVHTSKAKLDATSVYSENRFTKNWLSKLSIAQSKDRSNNEYVTSYGTTNDAYVSGNKTINWNNIVSLSSDWTLTAGAEKQSQSVEVDDGYGGLYTKERNVKGLYAGVLGQLGLSSFQLNFRKDSVSDGGGKNTVYAGYGFSINPNWKITASTATAYNIAPLGYLYAPYFGNPNLSPETAKSNEVGLQYAAGVTVARATLFSTKTANQFEYDFSTSQFANVKRTKNTGLELSYATKLATTELKGSFTSQNPVNSSTGQTSNRRAKTMAALSVNQPIAQWALGADLRYTGDVKDGIQQLNSYAVLDISTRYEFSKTLNAYARVENFANAKYQTVYGYNSAPRGVFVGLNWRPGF
jgi:vitamin B12 transporter